jgi:hypothetical protein
MLNAKTIKAKDLRFGMVMQTTTITHPNATVASVAKFPNGQVMVELLFPDGLTIKAKYDGDKELIILF